MGVPREPIHRPSGCAYLSLLSERMVSHLTAWRHFVAVGVLRCVEAGEERPGAGKLAVLAQALDRPDAVVGRAGEDGMAHRSVRRRRSGRSCGWRMPPREVPTRMTLSAPVRLDHRVDLGLQVGHVFGGRGAARLLARCPRRVRAGRARRSRAASPSASRWTRSATPSSATSAPLSPLPCTNTIGARSASWPIRVAQPVSSSALPSRSRPPRRARKVRRESSILL